MMISEKISYPDKYEDEEIVYAPRHYIPYDVMKDDYSARVVFSKKQDKSAYFWPYLKPVIDELNNEGRLEGVDVITIIPSRKNDSFSPTLIALGKKISEKLGVPLKRLIERQKETETNSTLHGFEERHTLVHGSIQVNGNFTAEYKKIIILDDVKASGITIMEGRRALMEAGATETIIICLGINGDHLDALQYVNSRG